MEDHRVTSKYFDSIDDQLSTIYFYAPWAKEMKSQFKLLRMDVGILEGFCLCHETLDYSADEESLERSVFTSLNLIWPKEYKLLSLLKIEAVTESTEMSIEDFCSAKVGLEAKIQQTRQQIEGSSEYLMNSSMKCKFSTYYETSHILKRLRTNLINISKERAGRIVPLKIQCDILESKIVFLKKRLIKVKRCPDGKGIHQFMNFICDFANSVSCLICLYWAKEDNEETVSDMNIVLFDTLHKFIPFAFDITPLYIGILTSYSLQPSHSFLFGKVVESFIDFFFDHLATILKEHYPNLRDRLIFSLTFLADPLLENEEEEEKLIHNQIYALLPEYTYLCSPFDEMDHYFFNKKVFLSDCLIKIDLVDAKIKQLDHGFSNFGMRLEVKKMVYNYFVSVHNELCSIKKHVQGDDLEQLKLYKLELRFLSMFLLCFATWDATNEEMSSIITSLQKIWESKEEVGLLARRLQEAYRTGGLIGWYPLASELEEKIHFSKIEIKAWCLDLFHWSFQIKPSRNYNILGFLDSILDNLNDLVKFKAGKKNSFKKQMETLEDKLVFLKNFVKLIVKCIHNEELGEFKMFVQDFANDAACLTYIYWTKEENDEIASQTNSMLSHMLQKIKPATPDVARLYFGTLKAMYVQRSDSHTFGQTAFSFVDFLLEDPVNDLKDDFQILQDDIVCLLTFLNDPPNQDAEELIYNQIDVHFWGRVCDILPFDDMKVDFSKKKVLLSDFMKKIAAVNDDIRHIYGKYRESSIFNFPKVISPYFLDCLIQNLRNLKERMISDRKFAPFATYKIKKIEEELVRLSPFFNHLFDLQSELNETWVEVVNLVHLTEHVINSCISSWFVFDHPIWYHMASLSYIFHRIKVVNTKLERIKDNIMYNTRCLPSSDGFIGTPMEQAQPSKINEIVVGFEDVAKKIMDMLSGGKTLDTVSIVGMGGLGKTTLAKKVYGLVKCNFDVVAFCSVSQDHSTRRLLVDILCDIKKVENKFSHMTNDDLAHELKKYLSRQKYLIVLDDIWNISAWNEVKISFPDDENGSRVMFTTRSSKVAEECKISSSPHELRFMAETESWELLQKMVFHNGISPPHLYEIGNLIAKNCKGLPLAVVVIVGILTRKENNLKCWSEIAERLVSYLSKGCMEILELSYRHLPEYLKPCLLYLGAFPEDKLIMVKQVIRLWIAEGFVQESKTKNIEDVAKDYFHDLVDRSFIIVIERNSYGKVQKFRIHDLILDLCQSKCRDGNFFELNHKIASSCSSDPSIHNHYRVSTQEESDVTIAVGSLLSNARYVLLFRKDRCVVYLKSSLRNFKLAQVLDLDLLCREYDIQEISSPVHLRHLNATFLTCSSKYFPSSISDLWNIGSLVLTCGIGINVIQLPESFWRMKSLRHVKIVKCGIIFSDDHEQKAYPKLDKVVSFSKPVLHNGKDVKRLLQRLPVVRKLSCYLEEYSFSDEESIETLDFDTELESLELSQSNYLSKLLTCRYMINFPSTLKKLTLDKFQLSWTAVLAIADLPFLQVLKLRWMEFLEPILKMEDITFQSLTFFEMIDKYLEEWNASNETFPLLEQLVIGCEKLEELPPCFKESSTLKRINVTNSSPVECSALRIQEEQMELGIKVDVLIYN